MTGRKTADRQALLNRASIATGVAMVLAVIFIEIGERSGLPALTTLSQSLRLKVHLLVHGVAFLLASSFGNRIDKRKSVISGFALFVVVTLSLVEIALVLRVFLLSDPVHSWVYLLAVPGIVGVANFLPRLSILFVSIEHVADAPAELKPITADKLLEEEPIAPEEGKLCPSRSLKSALGLGTTVVGIFILTLVMYLVALIDYFLLEASLFQEVRAEFWEIVTTTIGNTEGLGIWSFMVVGAVLIGVFASAFAFVYPMYLKSRHKDVNRNLSDEERTFIEQALHELSDYIEKVRYPDWYGIAIYSAVILVPVTLLSIGIWIVFDLERAAGEALVLIHAPTSDWYLHKGAYYGTTATGTAAGLALILSGIFLFGRISAKFGEFIYQGGKRLVTMFPRTLRDYRRKLILFVRTRRVETKKTFNPKELVLLAFREYEGIVYSTTLFLCVLVLPFHYLDTQTYYFFSEDGIVYSDYWPARQFAIDYEDVVRIEIGCKLSPEGGSSRDLNYTVFFDETHSADILGSEAWAGNLDAVAEVHRRFRAAGVPTMRQADFGFLPWQDRIGYQEDCNEAVFSVFGERRGARIAEILRLDRPGTP